MKINIDGLNENVKPWLEKSILGIEEVEGQFKQINDIPYGFNYDGFIKENKDLFYIKDEIKGYISWIDMKINEFIYAERANKEKSEELETIKGYTTEEILQTLIRAGANPEDMTIDEFFKYFAIQNKDDYGIDQGVLGKYYHFDKDGNLFKDEGYYRIEKLLMNKYNMTANDASLLIMCLDATGICSYAATAGNILVAFKDKPKEFEEHFGFSMYRKAENGKIVLNQEELLIDLYVHVNSQPDYIQNDAYVRKLDSNLDLISGSLTVDKDMIDYLWNGRPFFTTDVGLNSYTVEDFLNSKDVYEYNYNSDNRLFFGYYDVDNKSIEETKKAVKNNLENGKPVCLNMFPEGQGVVSFVLTDYTGKRNDGWCSFNDGGHSVTVTDITDEGIAFATWGYRGFIYFKDMKKSGNYELQIIDITEKKYGTIHKNPKGINNN